MATESKDDYYTKTAADAKFLSSTSPENIASVVDNGELKNLFSEEEIETTTITGNKVLNYDETTTAASQAATGVTSGFYASLDQTSLHDKDLYSVSFRGAVAGSLSFQIYNIGVTGRTLTVEDFPTLDAFAIGAKVLFTLNVDTSAGITEYKLDGTDSKVTYINPEFVGENGFIHIPTGYYIGAQQVGVSEPGTFYYGGNAGTLPVGFGYASGTGFAIAENSNIGIGYSITEISTVTQTSYSFDNYIHETTDEVTTQFVEGTTNNETAANGIATAGSIYTLKDMSFMNGKYLTGLGYVPIAGVEGHFLVGTVPNNAAIAAGVQVSNIKPLFTISSNNGGYSEAGSNTNIVYKFDGTDDRVTINATDLYDEVHGGFLWDSTKIIMIDCRAETVPSSSFYFTLKGKTEYWNSVVSVNKSTFQIANIYGVSSMHFMPYTTETTTVTTEVYHSKIIGELVEQTASPLKGKYLSMIGDSISTFEGWSNVAPAATGSGKCYYPKPFLTNVDQTYWKKLIDRTGMKLLVNNSYTGSRCANRGNGPVVATGANDRCKQLHKNGINPDYILINIGTNDFDGMDGSNETMGTWNGRGENYPANPDSQSPTSFREAYAVMLHRLRKNYPLAKIFCCTVPCGDNKGGGYDEFNGAGYNLVEFNDAIREIATAYGAHIVELATSGLDYWTLSTLYGDYDGNPTGVTTYKLHPSEAGMERYYEIIRSAMENEDSSNVSCPRSSALMKSTATAVANATDTTDVVTQLNALLSALRTRGVIAAS